MVQKLVSPKMYQCIATISGTITIVSSEMHFGWTSPSLPQLIDGSYKFQISTDQASWLVITLLVGTVVGAIVAGYLSNILGRKKVILLTAAPLLLGWLMIVFAESVYLLYTARFVAGMSSGLSFATVPMYLGEIAEPAIRGMLSSFGPVCVVFGILLINILGNYFAIDIAAAISCAFPVVLFLTFIWMPESPSFLIQKKQDKKAMQALEKFREANEAQEEFQRLSSYFMEEGDKKASIWDLVMVKENRKAALVAYGLRAIQQFCGTTAIVFYCKTILEESKDILSPNISSILYFTLQLVIAFCSMFLVDNIGRKPLLISSLLGSSLSLLLLSIFLYLRDNTTVNLSSAMFVPLLMLLLNVSFISIGVRNIPLLMMGEMFSAKIKPIALCCGTIFYSMMAMLSARMFYVTSAAFGLYVPFLIFTILGFLSVLFVVFIVPETKGKSLEDIQRELKGESITIDKLDQSKESYRIVDLW